MFSVVAYIKHLAINRYAPFGDSQKVFHNKHARMQMRAAFTQTFGQTFLTRRLRGEKPSEFALS